jgi:ribosomal protein S18 acetylase RimI-like enzyme
MVKVRSFDLDDVEYVATQQRLLNQCHQCFDDVFYAPAEDASAEFSRYISGRVKDCEFVILIAEQDMEKMGYAMGWIEIRPPVYQYRKIGYLSNIFVAEDYRHRGVGRCLLHSMEKWFKSRQVDFMEIRADVRNIETIRTFETFEFKKLSISFCKNFRKFLP